MLDKKVIFDGLKNNAPHKLIQRWRYYHLYFKKPCEIVNKKEPKEFEIYTIAFNNNKVIDYQIKLMKKNFKDNHQHIIVDNSSDEGISQKIRKVCIDNDIMYVRLPKNTLFTSQSHALALNYTWRNIIMNREKIKYFGFLDHDIFPVKKTSIIPYLKKQKMYGYLLDKEKLEYANNARTIWPGFCFFDKTISKKFDFRPAKSLIPFYALDTGGKNYRLIFRKYDKKNLEFISKELIGVRDDFSEFKNDYFNMSNYSRAEVFMKKNRVLYNYEKLKDKEWFHRTATYFNSDGIFSYEEYEDLLEHFYKKLDLLIS